MGEIETAIVDLARLFEQHTDREQAPAPATAAPPVASFELRTERPREEPPMSPPGGAAKTAYEEVTELAALGQPADQIASALGISRAEVDFMLKIRQLTAVS